MLGVTVQLGLRELFVAVLLLLSLNLCFLPNLWMSWVCESCLTPGDPMDCGPRGSSVHGILQARTLECVAFSFSRGSFRPRDRTQVSRIAGRFFTV